MEGHHRRRGEEHLEEQKGEEGEEAPSEKIGSVSPSFFLVSPFACDVRVVSRARKMAQHSGRVGEGCAVPTVNRPKEGFKGVPME